MRMCILNNAVLKRFNASERGAAFQKWRSSPHISIAPAVGEILHATLIG